MVFPILALWGCIPEITKGCIDMTNASSTYLSIVLGALLGVVIAWWIYKIQKKTTMKQDETLRRIDKLEESHYKVLESHYKVLESMQYVQKHQERLLREILNLDRKIDAMIEKENRS